MKPVDQLIVALDVPTYDQADKLIQTLSPVVKIFKVGSQLFTASGPKIIERVHSAGGKVFLDLKFHDIPNTVAKVSQVATELGVFMFNVHASGGEEMMRAAVTASDEKAKSLGISRPLIIAVTVLTSFSQELLEAALGFERELTEHVGHCARIAKNAGLDGVVASAQEINLIHQTCGEKFVIVTPGIRPPTSEAQDQKRTMTPREAIVAGSHYIVVGRPILNAPAPRDAAEQILKEMS